MSYFEKDFFGFVLKFEFSLLINVFDLNNFALVLSLVVEAKGSFLMFLSAFRSK
jgi:hypothetical protein